MCLLDDAAVQAIVERCAIRNATRVLDLGCGRGFLGRWLDANGIAAKYTGVDRVADAVEAARRHVPAGTITQGDFRAMQTLPGYDAVVALEVVVDGTVDGALLESAAMALTRNGRLALTVASLDGRHDERLTELANVAERRFASAALEDWTQRVRPFAQRTFEWWSNARWHPEIREKTAREARAAIDSIAQSRFHYAVLFART